MAVAQRLHFRITKLSFLHRVSIQGSSQKKVKEGVVVLRSKHSCGFYTLFRPHQRAFALERGVVHPSDVLARSLERFYPDKDGNIKRVHTMQ